jgi:Na+/proline symporter
VAERPNPPDRPYPPDRGDTDVWVGLALTVGLHLALVVAAVVIAVGGGDSGLIVAAAAVLFIGVSQLLYIVPAVVIARRRGRPGLAKGLIIGAALTFLLNSACWFVVYPEGIRDLLNGQLF